MVFIDRVTINAPDGKPVGKGSNRLVYLIVPVKDPGGTNAQLVIGGLTEDPADAPGPFGTYLLATTHTMQRTSHRPAPARFWTRRTGYLPRRRESIWNCTSNTSAAWPTRRNPTETKFYSAKNPGFYQISRDERVLDILKNVTTTPPDRVKEFSFKASGGSYAKLFDGTQKVLSWDNILWINRSVLLP